MYIINIYRRVKVCWFVRLQSAIFHHVCADLSFNLSAWFPENWLTSLSVPFRDTLGAQSQVLSAIMSRYATSLKKSYCSAKLFLGVNTKKTHTNLSVVHLSAPNIWFHTSLRNSPHSCATEMTQKDVKQGKTSKHIRTNHNILSVENCRFSSSSTSHL